MPARMRGVSAAMMRWGRMPASVLRMVRRNRPTTRFALYAFNYFKPTAQSNTIVPNLFNNTCHLAIRLLRGKQQWQIII